MPVRDGMRNYKNVRKFLYNSLSKAQQEIVSPWLRRHRSKLFQGYVIAALVIFALLALFANTTPLMGLDLEFTRELQSETPLWFGSLLQAVSWPGYVIQAMVMIAIVMIALGVIGLRWEAVTVLFASVFSGALNSLVKVAIRRPRPSTDLVDVVQELNSFSFPSGHVMFYVTFFGLLLFLTFILLRHSWTRTLLSLLLTAMIILVGPSRMYVGEHWASDVVGGYLLGSLTLILVIQFYHKGKAQFQEDQTPELDESEPDLHIRDEAHMFRTPIPLTSKKDADHEHHSDRPE